MTKSSPGLAYGRTVSNNSKRGIGTRFRCGGPILEDLNTDQDQAGYADALRSSMGNATGAPFTGCSELNLAHARYGGLVNEIVSHWYEPHRTAGRANVRFVREETVVEQVAPLRNL